MANKEQNNMTDWKARLDAMEHFDGEPGLDKTAAWEKAQQRLYGKQGRKKTILFWAAAACAGLIIVFVTIRKEKKPHLHGLTQQYLHVVYAVLARQPALD